MAHGLKLKNHSSLVLRWMFVFVKEQTRVKKDAAFTDHCVISLVCQLMVDKAKKSQGKS